jgi:hypothetical protein
VSEIERLRTALRRIVSLDAKNVPKYAQQIASDALEEKQYFCPILFTCPHWLDKCHDNGCQHPEAIAMREGK